jgi:hypothetical protein
MISVIVVDFDAHPAGSIRIRPHPRGESVLSETSKKLRLVTASTRLWSV